MSDRNDFWWLRGKFYSLYIDKFADNIPNLIERLPYFTKLGIDCLHLLPFYPSPMTDGGFDVTDHTGVRPELGTIEDFKNLCGEAHKQGIRIMVDLVLNHTSIEHPWFVEARASKDNPKRNFYIWSATGTEFQGAPNPFPDFKASNWLWNEVTQDYYFATFKPTQPELNWDNPEVQKAILGVVDTLISYGVDGFRLDAVMHLVEQEGTDYMGTPKTHARLRDLRAHLDKNHPHIILLGETIGSTELSKTFFGQSNECHLAYNLELANEMIYALKMGGKRDRLKAVIEAARQIPQKASWMSFLRNHDAVILTALDKKRGAELLKALDPEHKYRFSHDSETVQRLWNVCNEDEELVREAFAMLYSLPSATVMYYGDEIGMPNSPLPDGENDMRYTVRGQFDWNEAERQIADPRSLFNYVRNLIKNK